MFTNSELKLKEENISLLMRLIRNELVSIPIEHWGFFFPCHLAVWRFIEEERPGILGPLKATFRGEPSFSGKGSTWFCNVLANKEEYLYLLEAIMYPITRDALPSVRDRVRHRGFFLDSEIQPLEPDLIRHLAETVLDEIDKGIHLGLIE